MNLETFFTKFDELADTTNAVAKMRELILQLAAHGKLVEQSSEDEPASVLVGRIEKHVAELRSRKEFRGSTVEPLDREELPEIPSTWEWVRLGNVVDYGSSDKAESADISGDAWLLDLEDIEKDTSRLLQQKSFRDSPSKSTKTAFAVGDVLYGKLRPYLNKVIVAEAPGYCTTEIVPIRAFGFIDPTYLCHALKRPEFIAYANSKSYGMNLPRLGTEDARSAPFPLPPLAEQKRIVAKVDELMALCDRLEAQQQERETQHASLARASLARFADAPTPANFNFLFHDSYSIDPADLRKSILSLAFAGKLVLQDPNDEPASALLEKARAEKARLIEAGLVKKEPWAHKLEDATMLYELPPGWEWTHVSDVVEKVTVGFVGSMKAEYRQTGVPFLRSQNVRVNRYEPVGLTFISDEFHCSISKSTLCPGDVVVTRSGNVGVTCVIPESLPEANCSDLVVVKRPIALVPAFLSYFINSIAAGQIEARTVGIALTHFNTQSVAQMTVALPPLAEQRRIVAKVDQLMALVDTLETQLATARTTAEKLMEAVVAELTTQD